MKQKKTLALTFLLAMTCVLTARDYTPEQRRAWLLKAEQCKPALNVTPVRPKQTVTVVRDSTAFQGCKVLPAGAIDGFYSRPVKDQPGVILDFGKHLTGYVSFAFTPMDKTPDAPARLRFTFGETPSEMSVPFDSHPGGLSRAWLQDEVLTVMMIPDTLTIPRRLAFRYVKVEVIAAPNYNFRISDVVCQAASSARQLPDELPAAVDPKIRMIDRVGQETLKECMQTVYEDGPKRDQRLWIGDLYLESMANNYTFKQYDLTKRCLYLLAGLAYENGFLNASVFERPAPHPQQKQLLYEYALLFNVALKDYLIASGDRETALDLWPVAKRQLDIVRTYLLEDGLVDFEKANKEWWVFFDWKNGLYKEVALQGVSIFAFRETYELAKLLGKQQEVSDLPASVKKMTQAARKHFYDKKKGVFLSAKNPQVSYASQIWMILSGVATVKEGQKALLALRTLPDVCRPGAPYLYHYYIQALVDCGMQKEAREALVNYWGGMIDKGADTFWEVYDPQNDYLSPYGFFPMNSYCHAWSCTPVYFIRKYPEIFQ